MKINVFFPAVLGLLMAGLLASCSSEKAGFETRFKEANDAYFGQDENTAKAALIKFIGSAEVNESADRKEKDIDYDRVLAMAWLQLASIQDIEGDMSQSNASLDKAVRFFDRVEQIAGDPRYEKDKRSTLEQFLTQTESYQKPEWKKHLSSRQGTWARIIDRGQVDAKSDNASGRK
jgi:hypothetical protein